MWYAFVGQRLPEWIRRADLPVPVLPELRSRALATRVYAFLLAMIDGERTLRDIAPPWSSRG